MWGTRADPVGVGAGGRQPGCRIKSRRTVKILVEREQRIRLQFPEDPPQLLLDAVHGVEKIPAVDPERAGAQFPIRPEQEVITEHPVLEIVQNSFRDEAKIGGRPMTGVCGPSGCVRSTTLSAPESSDATRSARTDMDRFPV